MIKLRQPFRPFLLIVLIFASSCYSYSTVRIVRRVEIVRNSSSPASGFIRNSKSGEKHTRKISVKKYFAGICSFSPVSSINKKAIEIALEGRFEEAAVLFGDVIKEDSELSAAYNNLGIVFEFMGKQDDAFYMYSKACLIDPDNALFKRNFLSFIDATSMKKE